MTWTLTSGSNVISPDLVTVVEAQHESSNLFHTHLDFSVGVSLGDDRLRSGQIDALFTSRADAFAAVEFLRVAAVWEIAGPLAEVEMSFVRDGILSPTLDRATGWWTLRIGFQEVPA